MQRESGQPESDLSSEAAKKISPVGPVNSRGEPLDTPVHGMPAKPVVGDAVRGGPVNERGEPLSTPVIRTDGRPPATDLMPVEPGADAAIVDAPDEALPMPEVGEPVRYFAGPQGFRGTRLSFPAIVVGADLRRRTLDLIVFYDAQEFVDQTGVLERRGGERGFERVIPPGLMNNPTLRAESLVFGSGLPPMRSLAEIQQEARERGTAELVELAAVEPQPRAEPLDEATLALVHNIVAKQVEERIAAQMLAAFGAFEIPQGGFGSAINDHDERIEKLEGQVKALGKPARKKAAPKKK